MNRKSPEEVTLHNLEKLIVPPLDPISQYKLNNCTGQAVRVANLSTIPSPREHIPLSVQQLFDIS